MRQYVGTYPSFLALYQYSSLSSKINRIHIATKLVSQPPHVIPPTRTLSFLISSVAFLALLEIRLGVQTFLASMLRYDWLQSALHILRPYGQIASQMLVNGNATYESYAKWYTGVVSTTNPNVTAL
jgi:hypothetical protein